MIYEQDVLGLMLVRRGYLAEAELLEKINGVKTGVGMEIKALEEDKNVGKDVVRVLVADDHVIVRSLGHPHWFRCVACPACMQERRIAYDL